MMLGKVIGEVWATRKNPRLENRKMLLVAVLQSSGAPALPDLSAPLAEALDAQYPGADGRAASDSIAEPSGQVVVALDTIGAQVGHTVAVAWGSGARAVFKSPDNRDILADAAVVRVIDSVSYDNS